MSTKRILVVVTSSNRYGKSDRKTGYWLSEVSHPALRFKEAGFEIDFMSPKGGAAPIDPDSLDKSDPVNVAMLEDASMMNKLETTLTPDRVKSDAYDAIFFAGGMGVMWDFAQDERLGSLAVRMYESGKVVSAVCHGPAALLSARTSNGKFLVEGHAIAAFTNEEETAAGHDGLIPYKLQTALIERGAKHEGAALWQSKVVVSDRIITGQNPASASGVADAVIAALAS